VLDEVGIVHRDIHSDNFLVEDRDGLDFNIIMIDFGLSR